MSNPFLSRRAALLSLASLPLLATSSLAQELSDDPFIRAMQNEEKSRDAAIIEAQKLAQEEAKKKATQTRFDPRISDPALRSDNQLNDELSGDTGILTNEMAYEGKSISNVQVRYLSKAKNIPMERLLDIISTKKGMKYSATRANEDIERLVEKGLVSPDTILVVTPNGDSVNVLFEVRSAATLAGIAFQGNTFFDNYDLMEVVTDDTKHRTPILASGKMIHDRDLAAAREAILTYYYEARFPDTKVTWTEQPSAAKGGYRDIVFHIEEGKRVELVDVEFVGNTQFDSAQLQQVMKTQEKGAFFFWTGSGRINRNQMEDDLTAIVDHYRNFGYLRARVTKVDQANYGTEDHQKIRLTVHIDEGPRYRINQVSFDGNKIFTHDELEPALSMIKGDIYSLKKVADDITMVRDYYGSKGHADAMIRPDITEVGVDDEGVRLINIKYAITEGGSYRVGRVNIRGNTTTRHHVILREIPIKPGEPLNSVDLETARARLRNLGYFDNVQLAQSASSTAGYRDVNVTLRERRTGDLRFGVSFSTSSNLAFFVNVTQSNFDVRGFLNGVFVGGGQRLTLAANIGTDYQTASIFLLEPWFLDRKLAFGNEVYFSSSDYLSDYYQQKNFGYSVSLRHALSPASSIKAEYRIERYDLDPSGSAPSYYQENTGTFNRSHLSLSYTYDTRDAIITPRSGGHFRANVGYSGPGSTVQTVAVGAEGSYFYNSFWDTIFSVKFNMQTVDTINSDETVPIFESLYLGGPQDLRGFRYRDVGIVDPLIAGDETIGGKSSFFMQLEMTVPIVETIRMAAFMDFGFVHAGSGDFKPELWAADIGIGVRMNLPMGPLAADIAFPIETNNAIDEGMQFQFYADYEY